MSIIISLALVSVGLIGGVATGGGTGKGIGVGTAASTTDFLAQDVTIIPITIITIKRNTDLTLPARGVNENVFIHYKLN
jgi:hypothetical protein